MLKVNRFESFSNYAKRVFLVNNEEKYNDIVANLIGTKSITKSNAKFIMDYNRIYKYFNNIIPGVDISDSWGVRVDVWESYDKLKIKVSKYDIDIVDFGIID